MCQRKSDGSKTNLMGVINTFFAHTYEKKCNTNCLINVNISLNQTEKQSLSMRFRRNENGLQGLIEWCSTKKSISRSS